MAATRPRLRSRSRRLIQSSAEPQQRRMTEPQQRRIITLTRALRCLRQRTTPKFRRHPACSLQRNSSTCLRVLETMRAI